MVMADTLGIKLQYSHDGAAHRQNKHFRELAHDGATYQRYRVILIIRDLRDVVVSGYFEASRRLPGASQDQRYIGTMPEFVHDPHHGIEKVMRFYKTWHEIEKSKGNVLATTYEHMKKDAGQEMKRMLEFLGITNISERIFNKSVKSARFEIM